MPRGAALAQAERDVVRYCHTGLDVDALWSRVLRTLRRCMSIDAAFVATADPETLLFTGAHAEDPLGPQRALFLGNEFGAGDVNRFVALAVSPTHVSSLDGATHGDRASSPRYREIMRPLGLGDELRAALVIGGECWGYVCLHREDGPLGFRRAEMDLIARLGPHLAHALRGAVLMGSRRLRDDVSPGVVLVDDDLNPVASTPEAEHLLALLTDGPARHPLPITVQAVAAALQASETGGMTPRALPAARVQAADGRWLDLRASRLQGSSGERRIAVVVEPAEKGAILPILMSAHGLTARETDVARFVLRGASTAAISDALRISRHTVQDHLKSIFDKTGVRSRRDLVGLLLGGS